MPGRDVSGFCERCGRHYVLSQPAPGSRDQELDEVKSRFRFCSRCRLFPGRSCCWNPEAVACVVCSRVAPPPPLDDLGPARRGLAELAVTTTALDRLAADIAGDGLRPGRRPSSWDEAWWAASWLITRAESSRDAVARRLWHGPQDGDETAEVSGELNTLLANYDRSRQVIEERLAVAGGKGGHGALLMGRVRSWPQAWRELRPMQHVREWRSRIPAPSRPQLASNPRTLALPLVAVAFLVVAGAAAALSSFGGGGDGSPPVGAASTPPGGVLSGLLSPSAAPVATAPSTAGPSATPSPAAPSAAPSSAAPRSVPFGFDLARIGPLDATDQPIQVIAGSPEIAARPSAFDRSVRLEGAGSQGFCLLATGAPAGQSRVSLELYRLRSAPSGRLAVSVIPEGGASMAVVIPLSLLGDTAADRWYRVIAAWQADSVVHLAIDDAVSGERIAERDLEAEASAPDVPTDAVCVVASGLDSGSALFVDDLAVSQ